MLDAPAHHRVAARVAQADERDRSFGVEGASCGRLLEVERAGGGFRSGWNGGSPGVNTVFAIRADGWTVIALANYDPPAAERVGEGIFAILGDPPR